jgi:hypothetical protein
LLASWLVGISWFIGVLPLSLMLELRLKNVLLPSSLSSPFYNLATEGSFFSPFLSRLGVLSLEKGVERLLKLTEEVSEEISSSLMTKAGLWSLYRFN